MGKLRVLSQAACWLVDLLMDAVVGGVSVLNNLVAAR
jgi:hypothetical protein